MKQRSSHFLFLLAILSLFILAYPSCSENDLTIQPFQTDLLIDFQKGFYSDSVEIYINNEIEFSEKLTTNQYTRFAKRFNFERATSISDIKLNLINVGKIFEITLPVAKTLLVNNNRFTKELEYIFVNYIPNYNSLHVNDLQDLSLIPVSSHIYAAVYSNEYDILGNFECSVVNENYYKDVVGIDIAFAKLFSINFNTEWKTILPWESNWGGSIVAGDTLSIMFNMIDFQGGYVDTLCNTWMRTDIAFTDSYNNISYVTIDSSEFHCAY